MSNNDSENAQRIFEQEFFPHMEALKTFAFHLTYNDAEAEDLVQETYLKAHKFVDRYVSGTNAKAWLFKILKNGYINEYRKKSKAPKKIDFEDVVSWQDSDDPKKQGFADLRQELFKDRMGDEVTMALNLLPIDFRTVILLCDIEGFTYDEISKIIDVPIGTVRSRLFRARNILKELLKSYAEKLGYKDYRGLKQKIGSDSEEE